jgi:hypothetical protein
MSRLLYPLSYGPLFYGSALTIFEQVRKKRGALAPRLVFVSPLV